MLPVWLQGPQPAQLQLTGLSDGEAKCQTLLVAKSGVKTSESLLLFFPGSIFLSGLVSTLTSFPSFGGAEPCDSARADRCVCGADLLHSSFKGGWMNFLFLSPSALERKPLGQIVGV